MEGFITDLSVLLVAVAVLSYLAVIFRQPIIIAYLACGILIGPWGFGGIKNVYFIETISHLGITLLLFLAGLNLHPQKLFRLFQESALTTVVTSLISFILAFVIALILNLPLIDSICIGLAMMFSSTILAVKLLPTTELHHERMGAVCIGVLILQDLIAMAVLAFVRCMTVPETAVVNFLLILVRLVAFLVILAVVEHYVLRRVMLDVERFHEALFIFGLAWCFGIAYLSQKAGLFYETGAFFAGVAVASHPISRFIAEKLKPLRDFFLVLFFFSLGAGFDLSIIKQVFGPALLIAVVFVVVKPWLFAKAFMFSKEKKTFAWEAGFRLGQLSEFSLLVAFLALQLDLISHQTSQLIQLTTILTFVASSYLVVYKYPTPIGVSEKLSRD